MIPLLVALASLAHAAATAYTFDAASSQLYVQVFRDETTMGSDLAHDHVVLATGWSGSMSLDPDNVAACNITVEVPVAGLSPDLPDLRRKVGYTTTLTDAQQAQVKQHLQGDDQLAASLFPTVRFESTSCSGTLAALVVKGTLTVGNTRAPVQIAASAQAADGGLRVRGGFETTHQALGFQPYSAFFGTLKNKQPLKFSLDVRARPR